MEPGLRASAEAANLALFYCCTVLYIYSTLSLNRTMFTILYFNISVRVEKYQQRPGLYFVTTAGFIQGCPTHFPEQFQDCCNLTFRTHERTPHKYTEKVVCFKITPLNRRVVKSETIIYLMCQAEMVRMRSNLKAL